jgi:hypothetical protein
MPVVTQCTVPGCRTLTMGPLCIEHELPQTRQRDARDRAAPEAGPGSPPEIPLYSVAVDSYAREVRRASASLAGARARR